MKYPVTFNRPFFNKFFCVFVIPFVFLFIPVSAADRIPRVTIVMVVDQLAYHYIEKMRSYFEHGLWHLLHHGIVYENAHFPHGMPNTATGFAGLSTGTYASYHGIVGNKWYSYDGKKVYADDDHCPEAAEFAPGGQVYNVGRSSHNMRADSLSDQFIINQDSCQPRFAFALSYKSRSAIPAAGKAGKAIWFDNQTGDFTSSKAYFDALPDWLNNFNAHAFHKCLPYVHWRLQYPCKPCAYSFAHSDTYQFSSRPEPIVGKKVALSSKADAPYDLFLRTPAANQLLFDLAQDCIEEHVHYHCNEQLLLWIGLSSLDMVGHEYGPQSREVIDMIYHLDCQIAKFMKAVTKKLKRRDFLFVLTADHGVSSIPELMRGQGYSCACRIKYDELIDKINKMVKNEFGLTELVIECQNSQLYCHRAKLAALDSKKQKAVLNRLKEYLVATHLFKNVWTETELANLVVETGSYESFFKHQYYPGRSGSIIMQPYPYQPLIQYPLGATHRTPYEPDTHVPLIIYQKSYREKRTVYDKVWTLQLANTLANILHIPQPSASPFTILPGIIDYDPVTGEAVQPVVL